MPIIQPPTLYLINNAANQYAVRFSLMAFTGDAMQEDVSLPAIDPINGSVYDVSFASVLTPGRGNIPDIRCLLFSIKAQEFGGGTGPLSNIYFFNPQTSQIVILVPPPMPTSSGGSVVAGSIIQGCVPFYMSAVQTLRVLLDNASNTGPVYSFNVSALTFDSTSFLSGLGG
jgi:hypothetical protein